MCIYIYIYVYIYIYIYTHWEVLGAGKCWGGNGKIRVTAHVMSLMGQIRVTAHVMSLMGQIRVTAHVMSLMGKKRVTAHVMSLTLMHLGCRRTTTAAPTSGRMWFR